MATLKVQDAEGNVTTVEGVDLSKGVTIKDILVTEEWTLKTKDSEETYLSDHIGGRPDDRS